MEYKIIIRWDDEARVWYAVNDVIPLALESNSLDALIERVKIIAPEVLAENGKSSDACQLYFVAERRENIA